MKTIYTCIFGNYDALKEPTIITPGWFYICFTDQDFKSDIWKIKKVNSNFTPQVAARDYKINFQKYIDTRYSIWVDGSFQINCDLNKWWDERFKQPITCIIHPFRNCIYDEINVCLDQNRGDKGLLYEQSFFYEKEGLPKNIGLIQSGILMRENTSDVIKFCKLWFDQILEFSKRDQISFSYIAWKYKFHYNQVFGWKYGRDNEFVFSKHNKK